MPPNPTPEDYLRQALALQQQGRRDDALALLRQGAAEHPGHGSMRFLLGSLLAAAHDWAAAEREMAEAARLDPGLHIAHFQLGSLRMTSGDGPGALAAWRPLAALPESDALHCFARGCGALIADDFASARAWLQRGLDAPAANPALNRDMALLLARVPEPAAGPEAASPEHLLIHGYRRPPGGLAH